jgi:hypothetical protein
MVLGVFTSLDFEEKIIQRLPNTFLKQRLRDFLQIVPTKCYFSEYFFHVIICESISMEWAQNFMKYKLIYLINIIILL